jgi:hypothetical protein
MLSKTCTRILRPYGFEDCTLPCLPNMRSIGPFD